MANGYDGEIRIKATIDSSEFDSKIDLLARKANVLTKSLEKQQKQLVLLGNQYQDLISGKLKTDEEIGLEKSLKRAERELETFQDKYNRVKNNIIKEQFLGSEEIFNKLFSSGQIPQKVLAPLNDINDKINITSEKIKLLKSNLEEVKLNPEAQNSVKKLALRIEQLQRNTFKTKNELIKTNEQIDKLKSDKVKSITSNFDKLKNTISNITKNIGSKLSDGIGGALSKISSPLTGLINGFENLFNRIFRLGTLVLVFTTIRKAFQSFRDYLFSALMANEEFVKSLNIIKANLATAFYPIYQAILPALNAMMKALSVATAYLAQFISMLFGKDISQSQAGAKALNDITQSVGTNTKANKSNSKSLKENKKAYDELGKGIKKAKGELASFDKLIVLSQDNNTKTPSSPEVDTGGNIFTPTTQYDDFYGKIEDTFKKITKLIDTVKNKLIELWESFKTGFNIGFVDKDLKSIYENITKIGEHLKEIFSDPEVVNTFNLSVDKMVEALGSIAGAGASIGVTLGKLITGGLEKFLNENKTDISTSLKSFFENIIDLSDLVIDLSKALANVFSAFGSEEAQQILSDALSSTYYIFDAFIQTVSSLFVDLSKLIAEPFIENQEDIKEAIKGSLTAIQEFSGSLKETIKEISDSIKKLYKNTFSPFIGLITNILKDIVNIFVTNWNGKINPTLTKMGEKFKELNTQYLQPVISKFSQLVKSISDLFLPILNKLWDFLKPFVKWLIDNAIDFMFTKIEHLFSFAIDMIENIVERVGSIFDILKGLIDFISGVFTGNWGKAWNGALKVVSGFIGLFKNEINIISSLINKITKSITSAINFMIRSINRISFDLPEFLGGGHVGFNISQIPENAFQIPRLAQGAVLKGGNPMLAYLNDQPKGQVNVETPLNTMIEAFNTALKNNNSVGNVTIEASGDVSSLISFLNFRLKQENERIGSNLIKGDVWL